MDPFHDLKRRLVNWGAYRWRELMEYRPDGSCVNSIYSWGRWDGDDDGYGVIDGNTVIAPQPEEAKAEQEEIDIVDAENLDGLITQIAQGHRIVLRRIYVLRGKKGSPALHEAALRAITLVCGQNKQVNDYMRGRV